MNYLHGITFIILESAEGDTVTPVEVPGRESEGQRARSYPLKLFSLKNQSEVRREPAPTGCRD